MYKTSSNENNKDEIKTPNIETQNITSSKILKHNLVTIVYYFAIT